MTKPMRSSPLSILRASGRSRPTASPFAISLADCKGTPYEGGFGQRTLGHNNAMTSDTVGLIIVDDQFAKRVSHQGCRPRRRSP
jgi:hypothetical protein